MQPNNTAEKPLRVVVKIGTRLLTKEQGHVNEKFAKEIAMSIAAIIREEIQIILVTSGAVATGRGATRNTDQDTVTKQALAGFGQWRLIANYGAEFDAAGIQIAQVLLTQKNFEEKASLPWWKRFIASLIQKKIKEQEGERDNVRNALNRILALRGVIIANANDIASTEGIKFMSNDILAAQIANLMEADLLINLTSVDGIYDKNPKQEGNEDAKLIQLIHKGNYAGIDAGDASAAGNGGAKSKLEAVDYLSPDCPMIVANGNIKGILSRIICCGENPGTVIV